MTPNGTRWDQIAPVGPHGTRWDQKTIWDQMGPDGTTWDHMGPDGARWDQMGPDMGPDGTRPVMWILCYESDLCARKRQEAPGGTKRRQVQDGSLQYIFNGNQKKNRREPARNARAPDQSFQGFKLYIDERSLGFRV